MRFTFPPSFLWGSSISSYQTEGANTHCDWYEWERTQGLELARDACDHYHQFASDIDIVGRLGHNAFRMSLEWSRICPQKSSFREDELQRYRGLISQLVDRGITPIITLNHFTLPLWFVERGGWTKAKNIDYFLDYVQRTVSFLKDKVEYWTVINEPLVYTYNGYLKGIWPPGEHSLKRAMTVCRHLTEAYSSAYHVIKSIYAESGFDSFVSLAKHTRVFSSCHAFNLGQNNIFAYLRSKLFNYQLIDHLAAKGLLDFIGVNYYCREYTRSGGILGKECLKSHHKMRKNTCGWNVYPEGLYQVLRDLKRYGLPLIICENGTAEESNDLYEEFLITHLRSVARALRQGVDIRGYLWWTLIDNFEWCQGYKQRFGLCQVDFAETLKRTIRPFALTFRDICVSNTIEL